MSDLGNKQVLAENLQRIMDNAGVDRNKLCDDLGFKYSTVSEWLSARKYPRIDKIEMMANYFGVTKSTIIEEQNTLVSAIDNLLPLPNLRKVPRLGAIACGEPILAVENYENYDFVPDEVHCDFTLKCKGDSMINARIFDGDIVYIKRTDQIENGEIAAVLIDGQGESTATLKRVEFYPDCIALNAENPMYPTKYLRGEEMNCIRILGKAVAFTGMIK